MIRFFRGVLECVVVVLLATIGGNMIRFFRGVLECVVVVLLATIGGNALIVGCTAIGVPLLVPVSGLVLVGGWIVAKR